MNTAEWRSTLDGERADNAKNSLKREDFEGMRVGHYAELLNAQCDDCGEQIFGERRRVVEAFRNKHVTKHGIRECVSIWYPHSESPLSADEERFLRRWLPQARAEYSLGWAHAKYPGSQSPQDKDEHGAPFSRWTEGARS